MTSSSFLSTAHAVAKLDAFVGLTDDSLVSAQRLLAAHQRELDLLKAHCAAEIARRSDAALGFSGLARKNGFANAESFVQSVTGSTRAEATKFVRVGELLETSSLGHAVDQGAISVDGANAIRTGLGDALSVPGAVEKLVHDSAGLHADEILRRARTERETIDAEAIARAERQRRELRYLTVKRRLDGMVTGNFALSDEDGALVLAIFDQFVETPTAETRTVDPSTGVVEDPAIDDPRTRGQKAADTFAGLLRIAIEVPDSAVLGLNQPSVRVLVNADTIARREGHGVIEDATDFPISFETVERHLCTSGVIGVVFDDSGNSLNLGRDERLYTRRQRTVMEARDGGCRFPNCTRPTTWTEAHHINYWGRDNGKTDVDDGILLCRNHHLLIHDNHWRIGRHDGEYWLTPPPDVDPHQVPRPMPSKNPLMRELVAREASQDGTELLAS
ncbi:MAG: DUF222 domain-containing protein [Actinomycetota bacterium]